MPALYITSDVPGAGKTAVAAAIAARLSRDGASVGYLKPFSASPQDDADHALFPQGAPSSNGGTASSGPLDTPEGPLTEEETGELKNRFQVLSSEAQWVLVEGPSLYCAQGQASTLSKDVAEALDLGVLMVAGYRTDLTAEGLLEACEPFGQRLKGVLINSVTRYKEREVRTSLGPALEAGGVSFLGAIPEARVMLAPTVGQIAEGIGARWVLGQEKAQGLVRDFLIGGNIMDWGITYFGRAENKAVIVRGDRPDIQLAALATPTTCLILTGGHEPIQYVHHQAEQEDVPLLVVGTDTISTADALDAVLPASSIHHPSKIERFDALLGEHCDLGPLLESM